MAQDRRVQYTKLRLQQALVSLLGKKPVGSIDVTELCREAEVSRSTFYAHYTNLCDCLAELELSFLERINRGIFSGQPPKDWPDFAANMHRMLALLQQERETFLTLCRNSSTFMDQMMACAVQMFSGYAPGRWTDQNPGLRDCALNFVVYGMTYTVRRWLEQDPELPREQVAELILEFIKDGYWHEQSNPS